MRRLTSTRLVLGSVRPNKKPIAARPFEHPSPPAEQAAFRSFVKEHSQAIGIVAAGVVATASFSTSVLSTRNKQRIMDKLDDAAGDHKTMLLIFDNAMSAVLASQRTASSYEDAVGLLRIALTKDSIHDPAARKETETMEQAGEEREG